MTLNRQTVATFLLNTMEQGKKQKKETRYKAYLILGPKVYQVRWVYGEIPEKIVYGNRILKMKMVLWNCNNRATLKTHKFIELQALIYR